MYIGELSAQSGLSIDTLRYYEKIGLIPDTNRDHGGRRVYQPSITDWISFLKKLRATGMGVKDMARYAALREVGPQTANQRREMLEERREIVKNKIAELSDCLDLLNHKIDLYEKMEASNTTINSPLEARVQTKGILKNDD
ncbi:hypothetical protein WH95_14460 [Kiloniella litopenaei]|uniref:HTH merR-type domain-containing protein n=1 Tax=Kiloniella litopenaei TaxID=1549748 RepID=A0A0M2R9C6_9PROT|nr:MerR family transcriptional regulator [Kiloniella litopenaei]KKJ76178.1 hypothetical protein WH95_14460 [Kiloniella litopenaei]